MKVIAFNGSARKDGNTNYAINLVGEELKKEGIDLEIIHIGAKQIRGCASCFNCLTTKSGKCVIPDELNDIIEKLKEADGLILASPTYYANISGGFKAFLDRLFFVMDYGTEVPVMRHKVGASIIAVRRGGELGAYNTLNNYLLDCEMLVAGSNYWNMIFGMMPGDAEKDAEGVQTMQILGRNMAYLLKMREATKDTVKAPVHEPKAMTNFIR